MIGLNQHFLRLPCRFMRTCGQAGRGTILQTFCLTDGCEFRCREDQRQEQGLGNNLPNYVREVYLSGLA